MRMFFMILALISLGGHAGLASNQKVIEPASARGSDVSGIAQANNAFAFRLLPEISKTNPGNLFFSPFSIHVCFAMPFAGAGGKTVEEMEAVFQYPVKDHHLTLEFGKYLQSFPGFSKDSVGSLPYEMAIANSLWTQNDYPFNEKYLNYVKTVFASEVRLVNFKTDSGKIVKDINDGVAKLTRDKIQDLLSPELVTAVTKIILVNAVYFKGKWEHPFVKEKTADQPFFTTETESHPVKMMTQTLSAKYLENEQLQAICLPYQGADLGCYFFLPRQKNGCSAMEKTIAEGSFDELIKGFREEETVVFLPKFKLKSKAQLGQMLTAIGVKEAFNPATADFKRMLDPEKGKGLESLYISEAIHQAFVAVDEEGTEAAAATAMMMAPGCAAGDPPEPKVFKADHPFLFLIRHESTGAILFLGRVANPESE